MLKPSIDGRNLFLPVTDFSKNILMSLYPFFKKEKKRNKKKRVYYKRNKLINKLYKNICFTPCYYCKYVFLVDELTIEHILSRARGGTNNADNIALACKACNSQKGKEEFLISRGKFNQQFKFYNMQEAINYFLTRTGLILNVND